MKKADDADEFRFELELAEEGRASLMSRRLVMQALRYGVPLPKFNDKESFETLQITEEKVLTTKGMADVRAAIRNERNENWIFWELRLKVLGIVLTGATGAIGALIGLVSILKR